jgi:hypothetical protein
MIFLQFTPGSCRRQPAASDMNKLLLFLVKINLSYGMRDRNLKMIRYNYQQII